MIETTFTVYKRNGEIRICWSGDEHYLSEEEIIARGFTSYLEADRFRSELFYKNRGL